MRPCGDWVQTWSFWTLVSGQLAAGSPACTLRLGLCAFAALVASARLSPDRLGTLVFPAPLLVFIIDCTTKNAPTRTSTAATASTIQEVLFFFDGSSRRRPDRPS